VSIISSPTHTHTHTHTPHTPHKCTYICTHTHTCPYTRALSRAHSHTHTYTHTQSWCYACDSEITATSKKKRMRHLQDLKLTLRKHQSGLALARRKREAKEARVARKDAPRGVRGLVNMGNTCFFNSVLQSLAQCYPLREYFRMQGVAAGERLLTSSLRSFMASMWKESARGSFR
jgi:ubiquitin C-terminal hydrolase